MADGFLEYNMVLMWHLSSNFFQLLFEPLALVLAFLLGAFLFWRASRYELVDSQDIFDVVLLFLVGALFWGRVGDFILRYDFYRWSFARLFFFNAYFGFDFYFALLGGAAAVWFFLKGKRESFWFVSDLAGPPLLFALSWYFAVSALASLLLGKFSGAGFEKLFFAIFYFVVFWFLKRLEKQKRHKGFFACFAVFTIGVGAFLVFSFFPSRGPVAGGIAYELLWGLAVLIYIIPMWYFLSKRKIWNDLKAFFAADLLLIFKTKRVIFSVREADSVAKSIIFLPYSLVKSAWFLVKLVGREVYGGLYDFMHALGVGK